MNSDLTTWGSVLVYSLNDSGPIYSAMMGRGVYADWHRVRSLPTYQVLVSLGLSVGIANGQAVFIIDRFGNFYEGGQIGLGLGMPGVKGYPIVGATAMGGGYIGPFGDTVTALNEKQIREALEGISISFTADGLIAQISAGISSWGKYWYYYSAYGGFTPGVGGSAQLLFYQFKNEDWGWDRLEHGLVKVNTSGPAAQCSCGCRWGSCQNIASDRTAKKRRIFQIDQYKNCDQSRSDNRRCAPSTKRYLSIR